MLYVQPELLDEKIRDVAQKRQIPVLTLEWLFDCFKLNARQPEDKYTVSSIRAQIATKAGAVGAQESFAAAVLAAHEVLISPAALGSDERLLQMAEELGATALTWRSAEELQEALQARGVVLGGAKTNECPLNDASECCTIVVLIDGEEAVQQLKNSQR